MELTDDLVAVQGILISVIKFTGEFTKINYRGGNEEKILKIIEEIRKYIASKNYMKDGKFISIHDKKAEEIVLFLGINTKYNIPLKLEEYDHLIDIMPQLSKCVFANVIYGLDLCKYYCKVIEKLPLSCGIELLEEMVPCLKKSVPEIQLRYSVMFLRATAVKLSSGEVSENKDEDDVYKLSEVAKVILQFLTGIYPGHVKNLRAVQIYQHMGFILLSLFELLLYCNKENLNLKKFIDNILNTCCTIIRNVTINVFCSWAEINVGEEPLQSLVAEKAYEVIEEYQKYKEAKELISMLGSMAKKPKTLSERIQSADVTTLIKKVFVKDQDQIYWFRALLATQVFDNKDVMRCLSTWSHLCDENDVTRLLNLCHNCKNEEAKFLTIKCASVLSLQELTVVMTKYFYENNFKGLISDDQNVESQLKLNFNKMSNQTDTDDNYIKDMCLLLLQNPSTVLKGVYDECLRNKCYVMCYKAFFDAIKDIVNINNFGIDTLSQVISSVQLDVQNIDNYVTLFVTLMEIKYLSNSQIINGLLLPLLSYFQSENRFDQVGYVLQIFLGSSLKIAATSEMTNVRRMLLNTMNECRCTFLELEFVKQQTASYAVDVIKNLCEISPNYNFEDEPYTSVDTAKCYDEFTNYYKKYLSCKTDTTILRAFYETFNIENYTEAVARVLEFLPRAVTSEWSSILQELLFTCGSSKGMGLLTDVILILCNVVQSQDPNSNTGKQVLIALKYCLQQYGMALQNIQSHSTIEVEIEIARNVCTLLKHLPQVIKEEEGLSIISVLTQRSLSSLCDNREFVCLLISINHNTICTTLAQKMTNSPIHSN